MMARVATGRELIGGIAVGWWVAAAQACSVVTGHERAPAYTTREWPDGEPFLEQEVLTVQVFDTVQDELTKTLKKALKNGRKRN